MAAAKITTLDPSHKKAVQSLAFSADGKYLCTGSDDKTIRIWDAQKHTKLKQFSVRFVVTGIAFTADGGEVVSLGTRIRRKRRPGLGFAMEDDSFLSSGETELNIFSWQKDKDAAKEVGRDMDRHSKTFNGVVADMVPDQVVIAGSQIWRVKADTGEIVQTLKTEELEPAWAVTFAGAALVSGHADGTLALWNLKSKSAKAKILKSDAGAVTSLAWLPAAKLLVSAHEEGAVCIWDLAKRKPVGQIQLDLPLKAIVPIAASDEFVSLDEEKSIQRWSVPSLGRVAPKKPIPDVCGIAAHPVTGMLALGGEDGTVRIGTVDDVFKK